LGALLPRNGQPEQEYQVGSKALSSACDREGREDRTTSERGEKRNTELKPRELLWAVEKNSEPGQLYESAKTKMEQEK
jgi:hypothetical protein